MRTVLPIIVYTWLAVSLVIYGRRLYRRMSDDRTSSPPEPGVPPSGGPAPRTAPPPGRAAAGSAGVPHVPHVPEGSAAAVPFADIPIAPPTFGPDGTPHMDATHFPIEPAVAAALAEEGRISMPGADAVDPSAPHGAPPDAGRTGLFAKASDDGPVAVPLGTLMAGISLPCDLSPLVSLDDAHLSDVHARFVTSGHDPADVGRQVGDELERLGFVLASLTSNAVRATRDDGRLTVTIHTDPHTAQVDGRRLFPTTTSGDVVVEFTSG